MPKPKLYRFTVSGSGPFPEDMLRYDACWPASQSDVPLPKRFTGEMHTVNLLGLHDPTVGRWRSFGWTVGYVTSSVLEG